MRKRKKRVAITATSKATNGESALSVLGRMWGWANTAESYRLLPFFGKAAENALAGYYMTYLLGIQFRFDGKKNVYSAPYMALTYARHKRAVKIWERLGVLKIVKVSGELNHHFKLDLKKISELVPDFNYEKMRKRFLKNIELMKKQEDLIKKKAKTGISK